MTRPPETFGQLVKHWRARRRLSQLALACEAGISPRHLGFLEVGRSRPSREMVLTVSEALEIPLRERNALLLAAGFAPYFPQSGLSNTAAAPNKAVDFILERHEPNPVVVLDRTWSVVRANRAFGRLMSATLGMPPGADPLPLEGQNLAGLMAENEPLLDAIANAGEICHYFLKRLRQDWASCPSDEVLETLVGKYEALCADRFAAVADHAPKLEDILLSVDFRVRGRIVRLFSMVSVLGTVHDALLEELRIETFFPADDESAAMLETLAAEG